MSRPFPNKTLHSFHCRILPRILCLQEGQKKTLWFFLLILLLGTCSTFTGIYHVVQPGQTLYRISVVYGVPLSTLMRVNRINDPTQIRPGMRIFIPGAREPKEVPRTLPSSVPPTVSQSLPNSTHPTPPLDSKPDKSLPPKPEPQPQASFPEKLDDSSLRLIWPVVGPVVRGFQPEGKDPHEGIDISAPRGTPIRAAEEGRVIYSDNRIRGYGNMIIIRHKGRWATIYAHNDQNLVREGEFVRQGQEIARVGSTGRSTGSHLHFEVRYGRKPINPMRFLPELKAKGD